MSSEKMRNQIMWDLADMEAEGVFQMSYKDQKHMLIDGMRGYNDMGDKELIEYVKEWVEEEHHYSLWRLVEEFEAQLVIEEVLTEEIV